MLDIQGIRSQFPITEQRFQVLGASQPKQLIYLDHGASTHPPRPVLETYKDFLEHSYANVHRGQHHLSQLATDRFEHVSDDILRFIGAEPDRAALILLGNTTQALDLASHVMAGQDGITLVSLMEHHSNDLPHRARGEVVHFGVRDDGTLDYEDLERSSGAHRVKLVAVTGASNVTGYLTDVPRIARLAHAHGARILRGCRAAARPLPRPGAAEGRSRPHRLPGRRRPQGLRALRLVLPLRPGGAARPGAALHPGRRHGRVRDGARGLLQGSPDRHEGGTPNIAGAVAFAAALRFLEDVGMEDVRAHERALVARAMAALARIDGVTVLGHPDPELRIGALAMTIDGVPHELAATILNREAAIAVRNGCFCAHPYLHKLLQIEDTTELRRRLVAGEDVDLPGAIRPTFGIFNTEDEVDELVRMIRVIRDRAWKGSYDEIPGAAACKELRRAAVTG